MAKDRKNDGDRQGAVNRSASQQGDETRGQQATTAQSGESGKKGQRGPNHDPADIREHNDAGKDRLFEGRQQHDDAEKESERTRLSRDINKHKHESGDNDANREPDVTGK